MKGELRTQTVEIQKLRNNNRVLLGENLMLKQQQVTTRRHFIWLPTTRLRQSMLHSEQVWTCQGRGGHCTVRLSWTSLNITGGGAGDLYTGGAGLRNPPNDRQTDRHTQLKTLPSQTSFTCGKKDYATYNAMIENVSNLHTSDLQKYCQFIYMKHKIHNLEICLKESLHRAILPFLTLTLFSKACYQCPCTLTIHH